MKYKLLRLSLLSMLAVLFAGGAYALHRTSETVTATLSGEAMIIGEKPGTSYTDYLTTPATDDKGNQYFGRWCYQKYNNNYLHMFQLKKAESSTASRINLPKYPGKLQKITLTVTNASATSSTGTGAKAILAVVNSTTYSLNEAKANKILEVGSTSSELSSYVFDFTSIDGEFDGEGLYICSLDGGCRIWEIKAEYVAGGGEEPTPAFRDIKADLTSSSLIPAGAAQWDDVSTGISVAEDGTLSRIAKEGAAIVFNGKWHGTQYGWANFTATVPVQGCVKITLGGSNYGSGEMVVTNAEGIEVAPPYWCHVECLFS